MEHRIVPGAVVEHAGKRWRVERVLGADSVLLRGEGGPRVAADPARVTFPDQSAEIDASLRPGAAVQCTEVDWAEAVRRRDLVLRLAQQQDRSTAEIDAVATELGVKPRRVWQLLRLTRTRGPDIATFLPAQRQARANDMAGRGCAGELWQGKGELRHTREAGVIACAKSHTKSPPSRRAHPKTVGNRRSGRHSAALSPCPGAQSRQNRHRQGPSPLRLERQHADTRHVADR